MSVAFCAGGCPRLISISSIATGNPAALAEPDAWAMYYFVCLDCRSVVCDQCAAKTQGLTQHPTCPSCRSTRLDAAGPGSGDPTWPEPTAADEARQRGRRLGQSGQFAEAATAYQEALRHDPTDADSQFWAGVTLNQAGRPEEAVVAFERFSQLRPHSPDGDFERAVILAGLGRHSAALVAYDRAIALDPRQAKLHVNKALVLNTVGRFEEALAALGQAETHDDGTYRPLLHSARGAVLLGLHRDREALTEIDAALRLHPEDPHDLRNRRTALTRLQHAD